MTAVNLVLVEMRQDVKLGASVAAASRVLAEAEFEKEGTNERGQRRS